MTAPPDPAIVVQNQLFPPGPPPGDAVTLYEGADPSKGQKFSFKAWDLRGPTLRGWWDLLRFRKLADGKAIAGEVASDVTRPHGLYDWVVFTAYKTAENNRILRQLAQVNHIDISGIVDQ